MPKPKSKSQKLLTAEIAEQLLEDLGSSDGMMGVMVGIEAFTAIEDEAIEVFSGERVDLSLNGLTSLSDAAAESLSKYKGGLLSLEGLTSLSDAAAESLSKLKVNLYLQGLTSLSDAAAESLSKHKGGDLYLKGLKSLSDAAAESLSKHKDCFLP